MEQKYLREYKSLQLDDKTRFNQGVCGCLFLKDVFVQLWGTIADLHEKVRRSFGRESSTSYLSSTTPIINLSIFVA